MFKEGNMQNGLRTFIIFVVLLPVLIILPACSKKTTEAEPSDVSMQKAMQETAEFGEQLENERREHERQAEELRAEKIKFMYEDIYFKKGSYKLGPENQELLKRKALWLQKNPDIRVIIEGHTDEAGSKEYNLALGERRAGAVKSFLIIEGIGTARLIAVSYGNERPIDTGKTPASREKNRRVHFVVEE
jgi:peptidoglycan-associated lipoprotein